MLELTFLRHGESEGVQDHKLQGHLDLPLTNKGKDQIHALANYWLNTGTAFDEIFVSPLKRTKETAEIVGSVLNIQAVLEDEVWIERDFGMGEGMELQIIKDWYKSKRYPTSYEPIYESGETEWEVHIRAGKAIEKLMRLKKGSYLVVSHGNLINAILHMIIGILPYGRSLPVELALCPGCYAKLVYRFQTGRWSLISFNDRSYQ